LFLIVQDKDDSIKDLKDLVDQDKVKFGCVQRGSTRNFFKGKKSTRCHFAL
jgi:ABC-type amino acid transport substrate-binding protein